MNENNGEDNKKKEDKYKWVSGREHVLQCPDMYVGSTIHESISEHVFKVIAKQDDGGDESISKRTETQIVSVESTIQTCPAVFQLLLEVLTNAVDNHRRDTSQTKISVDIDSTSGTIKVFNNGGTIPIEHWPGTQRYRPEILFGELLSSQNYTEDRKFVTGRNGVGVKSVAVLSTKFVIELCDTVTGKHYKQLFENNRSVMHPPRIRALKATEKKSSTCISFTPDYTRFKVDLPLSDGMVDHLRMRVYDAAACTHARVSMHFCGKPLNVRTIKDYAKIMGGQWIGYDDIKKDGITVMEMCVMQQPSSVEAQVVGFVNGVRCSNGTHVEHIIGCIVDGLSSKMKIPIKVSQVKNMLTFVINTLVPNSKYTSQTKTKLAVSKSELGFEYSKCSPTLLKNIESACRAILEREAQLKEERSALRTVGGTKVQVSAIPKYEKATGLGSKKHKCMIFVTEGDSAKSLAVAGFSVIGRQKYGVFPLQGKPLNSRGKSSKNILENKELKHLIQILGLKPNTEYTQELVDALPYSHIMIMTDQDYDGSHIMGLIINMLDWLFPSLLKIHPNFVKRFATPIIKARIGREAHSFFSIPAYKEWVGDRQVSWVKYYKGLGTSSRNEAIEYFKDLDSHVIMMQHEGSSTSKYMDLFYGKETDQRKQILMEGATAPIDYSNSTTTINAFCTSELVEHGCAHNIRSMASSLDGMKPSNRKVLNVCLGRGKEEIKVASLAAITTEKNAYHHGEASLVGTIMKMAQWWVGTNNIAYLEPRGQFGNRSNARSVGLAAPRYVNTCAFQITRSIYPAADNPVLTYAEDDGKQIEPVFYVPVFATVLLNGTDGIGMGWRSYVPNYGFYDLLNATRACIRDDTDFETNYLQTPSFTGFKGGIYPDPPTQAIQFCCTGVYHIEGTNVRITELPPHTWMSDYKKWIEEHLVGNDSKKFVSEVVIHGTDTDIDILIKCHTNANLANRNLEEELHLKEHVSINLMHLFDKNGKLQHFTTPHEIVKHHAECRRSLYRKRLDYQICEWQKKITIAQNKSRFIHALRTRALCVEKHTRQQLKEWLDKEEYNRVGDEPNHFDYLIQQIGIAMMTNDGNNSLVQDVDKYEKELDTLKSTTVDQLWLHELDALELEFPKYIEKLSSEEEKQAKKRSTKKDDQPNKKRCVEKLAKSAAASVRKHDED